MGNTRRYNGIRPHTRGSKPIRFEKKPKSRKSRCNLCGAQTPDLAGGLCPRCRPDQEQGHGEEEEQR